VITVTITAKNQPPRTIEFPDEIDWTTLAENCRQYIFPGEKIPAVDRAFDAVMLRRAVPPPQPAPPSPAQAAASERAPAVTQPPPAPFSSHGQDLFETGS
jgi:hypothetical protein